MGCTEIIVIGQFSGKVIGLKNLLTTEFDIHQQLDDCEPDSFIFRFFPLRSPEPAEF